MTGLERVFLEWQARLRLLDWNIKWRFADRGVLGKRDGLFRTYGFKKAAEILVLDPALPSDPTEIEPYDPEITIVHEQLHCLLLPFRGDPHSVDDLIQEQAIHTLSTLLVGQQREIRALTARLARRRKAAAIVEIPAVVAVSTRIIPRSA